MKRADTGGKPAAPQELAPEIRPGQSVALLQELHILTRDGKLNQDSRRKLKQVYHLVQFIEPLLKEIQQDHPAISLVDHGAGKSYLGFILYDLFFKNLDDGSRIYGIETREELVQKSTELAARLDFPGMSFLPLSVAESTTSSLLPRADRHRHRAPRLQYGDRRRHRLRAEEEGQIHGAGAVLPGRSRHRPEEEQGQGPGQERADRNLAPPAAHARIRQPGHQRAALPAARSARLPGQRDGAGGLGALDEK